MHLRIYAASAPDRPAAIATPAFAEELIAGCGGRLSPMECPRSTDFEAQLRRHETGKLYKRLIQDRYWQCHERRIA